MSFFKKLVDTFTSNESKYNTARSQYIANSLNSIAELDLTDFPKGGKSRPIIISNISPLHLLSNNTSLDLIKTIELFYLYALGHTNENVREWYEIHLSRIFDLIKDKDNSFEIQKNEFINISKQTAKYIDKINSDNEINIYDASVVVSHDSDFSENGKYNSLFKAFYLFQGFSLLVGLPTFYNVIEIVEGFLIENNSSKFKKFADFSNSKILTEIINKNIELGILSKKEIEEINKRIYRNFHDIGFTTKSFIDWLILVLIYDGKTIDEATNILANLTFKLNESNKDWERIVNIYMIYSDFTSINPLERGKVIIEFMNIITNLVYYRVE
jgi:hypothetical protein